MKAAFQTSASESQTSTFSTAGEFFEDGSLLELIGGESCSAELSLLRFRQGHKPVIARVHYLPAGTYVPAALPASLLRNTSLPGGIARRGSTAHLFGQIVDLFTTKCGSEPGDAQLAAYFVFASHFVDCLDAAPCLGIAAEPAEGNEFLRVLAPLCRHALQLADLKSSGIRNLPRGFNPTLLLNQSVLSPSAVKALRASQHRGFGLLECDGVVVDVRCAKAFLIDEDTPEDLLRLCSSQIYLRPTQGSTTMLNDSTLREIAERFQPQLLRYRVENHTAVRRSSFDVPEFAGATRQAARSFGACVVNDRDLQAGVVGVLQTQDESARGCRWMKLDSLVVEALLVLCHENKGLIRVGEVADLVNGILTGREENIQVSARKVGSVLRSLNLLSHRDNRGYAFLLLKDIRRSIHQIGLALGVPTLKERVAGCEFCAEMETTAPQM